MKRNLILFVIGILVLATFVSAALPAWLSGKPIDEPNGGGGGGAGPGVVLLYEGAPKTVTVSGQEFTIEAVFITDVSAAIKVTDPSGNSATKEITEGVTKAVDGLMVTLMNADDRFFRRNVATVSVSLNDDFEPISICDTHDITITGAGSAEGNLQISYQQENVDDVSASLLVVNIGEQGGGAGEMNCPIIAGGGSAGPGGPATYTVTTSCNYPGIVAGVQHFAKLTDVDCEEVSDTFALTTSGGSDVEDCSEGHTCHLSIGGDTSSSGVYFGDDGAYVIELIAASDTSATLRVTDPDESTDSGEISEATSRRVGNLLLNVITADEANIVQTASLQVLQEYVDEESEVTYQGVLDMLNSCERIGIFVNRSDPFWDENEHPTGNSLCARSSEICVFSTIAEAKQMSTGSVPNEWGVVVNQGIWNCDQTPLTVAGRSNWEMYRVEALCCSAP